MQSKSSDLKKSAMKAALLKHYKVFESQKLKKRDFLALLGPNGVQANLQQDWYFVLFSE